MAFFHQKQNILIFSHNCRMVVLPYEYYLLTSSGEENSNKVTLVHLELARNLCETTMHSLAVLPALVLMLCR